MISYIFKSKIKNIFFTIFSAILLCIKLDEIYAYLQLGAFDVIAVKIIELLPYLLTFLYMVTLTREYKIKRFLFPAAFAFFTLSAAFSIRYCFDEYTFTSIDGLIRMAISLSVRTVMLVGYILCFIGTLSDFKRIILLRIGLPICIATISILGLSYYQITNWIGNEYFSTLMYLSKTFKSIVLLLFYISLLILTIAKKSEYIDITPFVEARKTKKEIKKAKRLERANQEELSPPVVSEGSWRCMGCGKILLNNINECECGYKKQ